MLKKLLGYALFLVYVICSFIVVIGNLKAGQVFTGYDVVVLIGLCSFHLIFIQHKKGWIFEALKRIRK